MFHIQSHLFLQFSSLYVMMHLFRINTVFKLLELLSFKGIFMRWKKSLSLILFKYFQPQQKLNCQKLIRNADSFLVREQLIRQNAVLQLCAHDWPILCFPRSCSLIFIYFQNILLLHVNIVDETWCIEWWLWQNKVY